MNCKYCSNKCSDWVFSHICYFCKARYYINNANNIYTIEIDCKVKEKTYTVSLNLKNKESTIYDKIENGKSKKIYKTNHILEITPANIAEKLKTYLLFI